MRIAYVCTDRGVPVFGHKGASVHVQAVLRRLTQRGHEVHLVTTSGAGTPEPELARVRVHHVVTERAEDRTAREVRARQADARVAAVLDGLHAERPLDLVYERYSLWGRTATAWSAAHAVPSVLEVNAPLVEEQVRHRVLVDRHGAEQVAAQALSSAGAVVCVSDTVAAWVRRHAGPDALIHTVPNGVDTDLVRPSARPVTPATGTPFTVGFVGTLKPWHGVETLVDAFALLVDADPTYRLLIVGDGPLAAPLRSRLERAGTGAQVRMTGAVGHREVASLLTGMDVVTAPYPDLEDFYFSPLKVYEYLAAGVPVVASRVGDLPTVLDHGRLGTLVEPGNVPALAAAVAALRADPQRRTALGLAARRRAVERHDWSRSVDTALSLARRSPGSSTPHPVEVRRAVAG